MTKQNEKTELEKAQELINKTENDNQKRYIEALKEFNKQWGYEIDVQKPVLYVKKIIN